MKMGVLAFSIVCFAQGAQVPVDGTFQISVDVDLVVDDKLKGLVPFLPLNLPNPTPARPGGAPSTAAAPGPSQAIPGVTR